MLLMMLVLQACAPGRAHPQVSLAFTPLPTLTSTPLPSLTPTLSAPPVVPAEVNTTPVAQAANPAAQPPAALSLAAAPTLVPQPAMANPPETGPPIEAAPTAETAMTELPANPAPAVAA